MPTPRETILAVLYARLANLPATALRGEILPERVPAAGLLILRDGEPGEPEVTLSPLAWHYRHRAEIEAVVQGANRDAAFDTLCASVGAVLTTDRTLASLCDWVQAGAPRPVEMPNSVDPEVGLVERRTLWRPVHFRCWTVHGPASNLCL